MSIVAQIKSLYKQGQTPAEITAALLPGAETSAFAEQVIAGLDAPAKKRKPRRRTSPRRKTTFRADSALSSFETQSTRTGKALAATVSRANGGRRICSWCGKDMGPVETELDSHGMCPACFKEEMEKLKNPPTPPTPPPDSITWHVAGQTIILPRDDDDSGPSTPPAVQAQFRFIPFTAAGRTSLLEVL